MRLIYFDPRPIKVRKSRRRKAYKFTSTDYIRYGTFMEFGKKCLSCGSEEDICIDHIIPISKGGQDKICNLQPLCRSCNSSKGNSIIDYRSNYE